MQGIEIPDEIVDERSGVHFVPVPKPSSGGGERIWKWIALVLTTLLAAGGLAGGFGHAFYVTRAEYTVQAQSDAVARENMRGTLERLDKTLGSQADAFRSLAGEVQGVKLDLAVMKKSR